MPQGTSAVFRLSAFEGASHAYVARLARAPADLRAAQALRFEVFNLELREGLAASFASGLDADPFDEVCDHLIVEDVATREIVGTYRLQTGLQAALHLGYYSALEFDLTPFEPRRGETLELGRACIARSHRNLAVLQLLWRGIAFYAQAVGARFLIGCSSIHGTDPGVGARLYSDLMRRHLAPLEWRTLPLDACACPMNELACEAPRAPKLMASYLSLGACICGPPALDRAFKTIDFLTLLDLRALSRRASERFFNSPAKLASTLKVTP